MIKHLAIFVLSLFLAAGYPISLCANDFLITAEKAPTERQKLEESIPLPPELRGYEKKEAPREDSFMQEFIKMIMTLGAIIIILLLVSYLFKKMANTRIQQINESSLIKIIERRSITAKTSIYLLDIKGKQVGVVESHNALLLLPEVPSDEI